MIDLARYELEQARAVDGDTVAAHLWRDEPIGYGLRQRVYSADENGDPAEASIRLPWVDTAEVNRGTAESRAIGLGAKLEAAEWLAARAGRLHVIVFGAGGLGRLLGDVRDDQGDSLAQHQLQLGAPLWQG